MKVIKGILGATAGATMIYGVGAFVGWDLNAGNWDPFGRALAGLTMPFFAAVFGIIAVNGGSDA